MPFKSEKQRKWMWANDPEMARKWENEEVNNMREKIKNIVREEMKSLAEAEKVMYVVALENGEVMSGDKAVSEKKALQIMSRIARQSDGWVNPFMLGVKYWNGTHPKRKGKPHKANKKKIMVQESGVMYRAGVKRYSKEGMKKIQQAVGRGEGHAEIGKIKDKYDKKKKKKDEGKVPYKQIGTNKNDGYILHGKDIPVEEAIGRGMKWEDLKSGTSIEFTGGTTYVVTKIDKNKLQMSLKRRGKTGGGLFAPKAKLDKSQFESQVKVGLIKYLVNTNPRG